MTNDNWLLYEDLANDAERQIWTSLHPQQAAHIDIGGGAATSGAAWGQELTIRAKLIRQIVTGNCPALPTLLHIKSGRIRDSVDLEAVELRCPLHLEQFYIDEKVNLKEAWTLGMHLSDCLIPKGIDACQIHTKHNFVLTRSKLDSQFDMTAARIGGKLDLNSTTINNQAGAAIIARDITVEQGACFDYVIARGRVELVGSTVGGLSMTRAQLTHSSDGIALHGARIAVLGSCHLDAGFRAEGNVDLTGSAIRGRLLCSGGNFIKSARGRDSEKAIDLSRATVDQNAQFCTGFYAAGMVRLVDMEIIGSLECEGGRFENEGDTAIFATGVRVGRDVSMTKPVPPVGGDLTGFEAKGRVIFNGAKIGGKIDLTGGAFLNNNRRDVTIEFRMLSAGQLVLDRDTNIQGTIDLSRAKIDGRLTNNSSILSHNVLLKGLSYAFLEDDKSPQARRRWLTQEKSAAQIYNQLASFYALDGEYKEAKRVLVAGRDARRRKKKWPIRATEFFLAKLTVGYGYYPFLVLIWLVVLEVVGGLIFGHLRHDMILSHYQFGFTINAAEHSKATFLEFNPWLYTLDLLLPVVDLKQATVWIPIHAAEGFSALFTLSGWALATALVVGLGSIFRGGRLEDGKSAL